MPDRVQSRAERKSRKALQNIGLKQLAGIQRVVLRRPRGVRSGEMQELTFSTCTSLTIRTLSLIHI